jgi:hypothetical protein
MIRALTVATTIAAMCVTLAAYGPSAATAAPMQGKLSATEFKQLSAQVAGLESSLTGKSPSWAKAAAACRRVGVSTPLLKTQRENCLASIGTVRALLRFTVDQTKCASVSSLGATEAAASTATTPTTFKAPAPTPGAGGLSAAKLKTLSCLNSDYQALSRLARTMYTSDVAARQQALARGFKGLCLRTLADTSADLRLEGGFAATAKDLAADIATLTKVSQGKAPASTAKGLHTLRDAKTFGTQVTKLLAENGPDKLSVCPHA